MGVFFMNWKIQTLMESGAFYLPSYQSLWTLQWQKNVLRDLHYISDAVTINGSFGVKMIIWHFPFTSERSTVPLIKVLLSGTENWLP